MVMVSEPAAPATAPRASRSPPLNAVFFNTVSETSMVSPNVSVRMPVPRSIVPDAKAGYVVSAGFAILARIAAMRP